MRRQTEVKPAQVAELPVEEILWNANVHEEFQADDSDEENGCPETYRLVEIVDTRGAAVAMSTRKPSEVEIEEQIKLALEDAFTMPLSGQPRKPRWIILKDLDPFTHDMLELHMESLDIEVVEVCPPHVCCSGRPALYPVRACSGCQRRASQQLLITCPSCGVIFWCSESCKEKVNAGGGDHEHQLWCDQMKQYQQNSEKLAAFPFTFSNETTSIDFDRQRLKMFLVRQGLFDKGLWRKEWLHTCSKALPPAGDLIKDVQQYVISADEAVLRSEPTSSAPLWPMVDWSQYYAWRGIPLTSPVAALLSDVLTVYYILTSVTPICCADPQLSEKEVINLHMVGVKREVDAMQTFFELSYLLPDKYLDIVMVGPEISKKLHGRCFQSKNGKVKISVNRNLYHNCKEMNPDLIIGLNSGFGAYRSWVSTVKTFKEMGVPAYFTDYCRYSCECCRQAVEGLQVGSITQPVINPFRSPLRKYCEQHTMPWYSNAFIYGLTYSS